MKKDGIYTPPGCSAEALKLLEAGRVSVEGANKLARAEGYPALIDTTPDLAMRVVIDWLLLGGASGKDWKFVAAGVALLQEIELKCRVLISAEIKKQAESN